MNFNICIFLVTSLNIYFTIKACEPPKVTLKLDGEVNGHSQLNFEIPRKKNSDPIMTFHLHCQHNIPIRWIINEDTVKGEKFGESSTNRTFLNFNDPKTYTYTATYFLQLKKPVGNVVYICQPFQKNCGRTIVLTEEHPALRNSKTKNITLRVLKKDEINESVAPLEEFDKNLAILEEQKVSNLNKSCPFILNWHLWRGSFDLAFSWDHPSNGTQNIFNRFNAQSLPNADLFYPLMEERCINFVQNPTLFQNCSNCAQQNASIHQFFPVMLTYILGSERRSMKGFFDLKPLAERSLWYVWEYLEPEWTILAFQIPSKVYKGQPFSVYCYPSVYFYSHGTQISWKFNNSLEGFANDLTESVNPVYGGTFKVNGTLTFDRQFLMENQLNSVEVNCVSPKWDSKEWVNKSLIVQLEDSEPPQIISTNDNDEENVTTTFELTGTEEDFLISCSATGIPLPTLKFIPPKINFYGYELETNMTEDVVTINVRFPNISIDHEGIYICLATSVIGEDRKYFEIKLTREWPQFLKIILAVAIICILIFAVVASFLFRKLKKEKAEFLRKTEEAVKKFREGFQNSQDLGFKSNSEYKNYEIPIARWGLGNTLLGSGAFGVVQKGVIYHGDNRQDVVAVKTVNAPKEVTDFENSLMELTIMSYIGKHEHVVSLVGACTDNIGKRSILIGVEYCANGDLLNYIQKRKAIFRSFVNSEGVLSLESITGRGSYANVANAGNFNSLDLYKWAFQIANGMDYLNSKKILHADLAARNVLLTKDNTAKISDFGLSRQLIMSDNYTKKTNTPLPWRWMALESLKFRKFSSSSDVWGYGVTLFEIFTLGEEPWPNIGWTSEFMDELERGKRLSRPKYATSNLYEKVMLECWRNEPNERITFAAAKEFFETAITNLTAPEGKDDAFLNNIC